jgi:hypothetical protein
LPTGSIIGEVCVDQRIPEPSLAHAIMHIAGLLSRVRRSWRNHTMVVMGD